MFTGLIEQTGAIVSLEEKPGARRITIDAGSLADRLREGDSIAVSGVCLTALNIANGRFSADLAQETIDRTSLLRLTPGSIVNLELPTPAGTPLGGHVVQGHVDTTGQLISIHAVSENAALAETDWWLTISVPDSIAPFFVEKGSIAIEGISLTVARWTGSEASIAVIPHTYARTNLHSLKPGDPVNLEADVLMKFAARHAATVAHPSRLTAAWLIQNGY